MPDMSIKYDIPPGFTLRHTLRGHKDIINRIAWSPDGSILASPSEDKTIRLWETQTGQLLRTLKGHSASVFSVAWSPDGRLLASGSEDKTIRLWDVQMGQPLRSLKGHTGSVSSVAWSPDGRVLASSSHDQTIRLWNATTRQTLQTLYGHSDWIYNIAWSSDGQLLASGSTDRTIRLWDSKSRHYTHIVEGLSSSVRNISFSYDDHLLASKSGDGAVRIWYVDTWEQVETLKEDSSDYWSPGLAFHPKLPILATLGEEDKVIRIWDLDVHTLLGTAPATPSVHYTNAKVVLVGDSGVGKSGLGLVLTGQPFVPTESTHGRNVWNFDSREVDLDSRRKEKRETLLWDLAGQPGYRLIHQLHLSEVALALVVFDSHNETDPFAGVRHWVRALRLAEHVQGNAALRMKKFLVAARIDRGGKSVSRERIDTLMQELEFDGYFETSAKEGLNIALLIEAIKNAIEWEMLPKVISTQLFQSIKAFLVTEKEAGRRLSASDDLYQTFLKLETQVSETEDLPGQFATCIGRVESQGLIRRLSFGNLVLLQPELLDAYAAALVNAVRDEPDGLGSILEEKVRVCDFAMPKDERLTDKEQERLLLIAMVEDLLRYEIALREQGEDGQYLVFPAQSTRENPDLPDPEGKMVVFGFEGPVQNIYAALAVRLSHSGVFKRKELWKDAMTFTTRAGATCGMFLRNIGEGRGELTLFFDKGASEETRLNFEDYVELHLQRRAIPESITRRRIFVCGDCEEPLTEGQVMRRRERGYQLDRLSCLW